MALMINEDCTNCGACGSECPNEAISEGEFYYVIDPDRCTECLGFFAEPQCVAVCPLGCIVAHPQLKEDKAALVAKFKRLYPEKQPVLF